MKLIVGLGNPGTKYARTRHNIGFMLIDALAGHLEASKWHVEAKMAVELAEAELEGQKLLLAKPQTFMNNSGEAVQKVLQSYRLKPSDVWVIHDDIDLAVAEIRVKQGGGDGGQKGVESIARHMGTDFNRIRIGIGQNARTTEPSEVYVLRTMPEADITACLDELPAVLAILVN